MSDARWSDPRDYDARDHSDEWPRVYDARDRDGNDPREALMRDLDLPRGDERELVVDRDRVYELDGEGSRALAAVGAFRIVPEHDLDLPHDTLPAWRSIPVAARTRRRVAASGDIAGNVGVGRCGRGGVEVAAEPGRHRLAVERGRRAAQKAKVDPLMSAILRASGVTSSKP